MTKEGKVKTLSGLISENHLRGTVQFLEGIEAILNGLSDPDRYVRTGNIETLKYLIEEGIVSPEEAEEKVSIYRILKDLEDPDRYVRAINAEALNHFINAGVINTEEVKKKISLYEILKNLKDADSYARARNAEVLKYLVAAAIVTAREVGGKIPADIILAGLGNEEGHVRARNAEAIKYLVEAGVLSPKKVEGRVPIDAIVKDIINSKGYARARNIEALQYMIEAGVADAKEVGRKIPPDAVLEHVRGNNGQVRAITTRALRCFVAAGVFEQEEVRERIPSKGILGSLKDPDRYVRAINAEALKDLMEAGILSPEAVTGSIPPGAILADARDRDGYVRVRSVETLRYLFETGALNQAPIKGKIPLKSILGGLEDPDRYVRAINAKMLGCLIGVGALDRGRVRRHLLLKRIPSKIRHGGKGLGHPDGPLYARNAEVLIYLVESGVVSRKEIRKTILDGFKEIFLRAYNKPLEAKFNYYFLRLFELLRNDHRALPRIEKYLDHSLLALSNLLTGKSEKDFFYSELAEMIKKDRAVKDTHNILAERLQDFVAARLASLSESDPVMETTLGRLVASIIKNKGPLACDKIKKAFRLLNIEFKDAGNSPTTTVGISKAWLTSLPPLEFKKLPVEPPAFQPVEAINSIPEIDGPSLKSAMGNVQLYKRLGRTLVYKTTRGNFIAIKFLKRSGASRPGRSIQDEREDSGRLIYESKYFDYLHALKDKGVALKGTYPSPLFIHGQRAVRINCHDLPEEMKARLQELSTEPKSHEPARADTTDGYYTFMAYTIGTPDYFTYLHEADTDSIEEASEKNIHDLFTLAGYGLIHPDIIDLFHNLIQIRRPEEGRFLWNVDIIRPMAGRAGAGRLHGGRHAVSYPNMRLSGPADFAEMVTLEALVSLDHPHSAYMKFNLRRFFLPEREKILLAHFMGNYLLAWVLIEGRRLKERPGELNRHKPGGLAKLIKKIYTTAYKALTGSDSTGPDLSTLIDWDRFAGQMTFFMGQAYKKYVNRPIPEKIFGKKDIYITPGDGWGFIQRDVVETTLNLHGERLSEVLDKYFSPATSERRIIPPSIFIFKPHFNKLIKKEKDSNLRPGLEELYENYATGWRFDGINEDIGPVNGPFPLQELIKANYIFSGSQFHHNQRSL
ncbi:MAG: hypothetical protein QME44_02255 [Thermodesulfobacteriota bacterium]|nr:hypothetical protein [Thermodesulfobacteriota bacterium]